MRTDISKTVTNPFINGLLRKFKNSLLFNFITKKIKK